MECMNSETLDYMYIAMLLLGFAGGTIFGAVVVGSFYKKIVGDK